MPTAPQPISRLSLRQYKSIERCDLELGRLTLLVGRNGAGKSNILDAMSFVVDALRNTLEFAIRKRGGFGQVRPNLQGIRPTPVSEWSCGSRTVRLHATAFGSLGRTTPCIAFGARTVRFWIRTVVGAATFQTRDAKVVKWTPSTPQPPWASDRLYLVTASGLPEFRPVYDVLTRMVFHNLNPEAMKQPQRPEPSGLLSHDGANLPSVIKQLTSTAPERLARVLKYIRSIGVPIEEIGHKQSGSLETLEVLQRSASDNSLVRFEANALSDGTIRALGILISLVSAGPGGTAGPSLVGIEEPETALHPACRGRTDGCSSRRQRAYTTDRHMPQPRSARTPGDQA